MGFETSLVEVWKALEVWRRINSEQNKIEEKAASKLIREKLREGRYERCESFQ